MSITTTYDDDLFYKGGTIVGLFTEIDALPTLHQKSFPLEGPASAIFGLSVLYTAHRLTNRLIAARSVADGVCALGDIASLGLQMVAGIANGVGTRTIFQSCFEFNGQKALLGAGLIASGKIFSTVVNSSRRVFS